MITLIEKFSKKQEGKAVTKKKKEWVRKKKESMTRLSKKYSPREKKQWSRTADLPRNETSSGKIKKQKKSPFTPRKTDQGYLPPKTKLSILSQVREAVEGIENLHLSNLKRSSESSFSFTRGADAIMLREDGNHGGDLSPFAAGIDSISIPEPGEEEIKTIDEPMKIDLTSNNIDDTTTSMMTDLQEWLRLMEQEKQKIESEM